MQVMPRWDLPDNWIRIQTIDAHTAGEPLRVITGGYPSLPGDTILEKRAYARQNYDHIRTALMWEPRGHADMYGCVLTEPETHDGTIGVVFLHNEGYSTMCGHGIIGLAKVALDTGLLNMQGERVRVEIDTPSGRVSALADRDLTGTVKRVSFDNVPSFVYVLDRDLHVPGIGPVRVDIAYGGAFYAFCQAADLGLELKPSNARQLIEVGMRIKRAVTRNMKIEHPFESELGFLYGTIFIAPPNHPGNHSRNVCIFADGQLDRCPTGTGLSARAAIHFARKELDIRQPFVVESILGTTFSVEIGQLTPFGPYEAIIPRITGTAHITGRNEWIIDPDDPLRDGFFLR